MGKELVNTLSVPCKGLRQQTELIQELIGSRCIEPSFLKKCEELNPEMIAVIYAFRDGSTRVICDRLSEGGCEIKTPIDKDPKGPIKPLACKHLFESEK